MSVFSVQGCPEGSILYTQSGKMRVGQTFSKEVERRNEVSPVAQPKLMTELVDTLNFLTVSSTSCTSGTE